MCTTPRLKRRRGKHHFAWFATRNTQKTKHNHFHQTRWVLQPSMITRVLGGAAVLPLATSAANSSMSSRELPLRSMVLMCFSWRNSRGIWMDQNG